MRAAVRIAILAVAATIGCAGFADVAAARPNHCRPTERRTQVVSRSNETVVLRRRLARLARDGNRQFKYYVCLRTTGRTTFLYLHHKDDFGFGGALFRLVVGHIVAFQLDDPNYSYFCFKQMNCTGTVPRYDVVVLDAANGHRQTISRPGPVDSLALSRGGQAAWLEAESVGAPYDTLILHDDAGERVVDRGNISAIKIQDDTLTWNNAGQARSMALS